MAVSYLFSLIIVFALFATHIANFVEHIVIFATLRIKDDAELVKM